VENSSGPAGNVVEEKSTIKKTGMWFVVIGSLGAILMSGLVFHSLDTNKVLLGASSSIANTGK
jgi:hypothetical protein